ncbi:MAG TPA: HD-GYP domain-containing protein [Methylotenera sp.]|nr:HD-GYP domain-containing protein [Methylotenera sp.]
MSDIRREKTQVSQLDIGMFVCELDRPWLESPFMLEGLLIEDDEQVETLKNLCEFVYVDHTVSVGNYFISPAKEQVAIKRDGAVVRINPLASGHKKPVSPARKKPVSPARKTSKDGFSFFEVLKEIKASNQSNNPTTVKKDNFDNVIYNVQSVNNGSQDHKNPLPEEGSSLTTQIKEDFSNFITGLTSWGSKPKKAKSGNSTNTSDDGKNGQDKDDSYRITIFEEPPPVEEEIAIIYPVYEKTQIATKEIFEALAQDQKIDLTNVNESLNSMVDSIERNPDALIWLAKLKQTDDYAYNQALNVSINLMALANFMSLPKKQVKELGLAGLLQDIGKVKVPSGLLHKQEKITREEFNILKKHVDYALELLEATENIPSTVILTVSQHHERIDGSGYPYKLSGKQISLPAQMAGLIDTYCALTSNKVYAKGVYNQLALEEIHAMRDTKFSSALIDQLVQFLGMYPVSSLVELNTGEIGVVIQQNSVRRLMPRIMILLNPDKTKNEYPATINLLNSPPAPSGEPYKIIRGLPPDSYGLNLSSYYG